MNLHIGSSSYLSRSLSGKQTLKLSSKKKNYYKFFYTFLKKKINFYIFFIGVNFKKENKKLSKKINFTIPLKLIKEIIKNKQNPKIIFLGSFQEKKKKLFKNQHYIYYKKELLNEIKILKKNYKFEYVWLRLPNIYGYHMSKDRLISNLIANSKIKKKTIINNPNEKIYLLNIKNFKKVFKKLIQNWSKYKNKTITSCFEGPFVLKLICEKISKKFKVNFFVYKKNNRFSNFVVRPNITVKKIENFSNFLKKHD